MSSGCFLALRSPLTASFYQVWWYVQSIGCTKVNQSFSHGIFKTRLILVLSLPYWGCTNLCAPLKSPRNVGFEARWLRITLFSKHALKHTLKPLPLTPVLITCQCFSLPGNKHCWLLTFILYGQHLKGIECYCKSNFHRAKRKQPLPFMLIFFVFVMVGIKGNFVNQQIYIKIKYRHNNKPCHLCLWHLIWLLILSQFFVVGRSANKTGGIIYTRTGCECESHYNNLLTNPHVDIHAFPVWWKLSCMCICVCVGVGADIQDPGRITNIGALNLESAAPSVRRVRRHYGARQQPPDLFFFSPFSALLPLCHFSHTKIECVGSE